MYYLERGLGSKWLASSFALFGIAVALFGIGTFPQVNAIADSAMLTFNVPKWITGLVLAVLVGMITRWHPLHFSGFDCRCALHVLSFTSLPVLLCWV